MGIVYECRCLVCDHTWVEERDTEPCPECGEYDDVYSEEVD